MLDVIFYRDSRGQEPVADFINGLMEKSHTDKGARINFNKVVMYIDLLCEKGTRVGEPIVKYLNGGIWELRPLDPAEIEQAKRNLADYVERNGD